MVCTHCVESRTRGRACSITLKPSVRKRRMLMESASCHVSVSSMTSIDCSCNSVRKSSTLLVSERTLRQPNTSFSPVCALWRSTWSLVSDGEIGTERRAGRLPVTTVAPLPTGRRTGSRRWRWRWRPARRRRLRLSWQIGTTVAGQSTDDNVDGSGKSRSQE